MTDEEIWAALEAWRNSEECKQLERIFALYEQAERIHQAAIAAMHPVRIYTTDNTRPVQCE